MIHYNVCIANAAAHYIDVQLRVTRPDPEGQLLRLPNWIPGSYMIRDFSRNIVSIVAFSGSHEVTLEKLDKSTWRSPALLEELIVHYRVYAWDLSVRAAHVDRNHAFFNGTSVFLEVQGQANEVHQVTFLRPSHDVSAQWRLASAMESVDVDASGFGTYRAENYDELIDHPVEQGVFKRLTFDSCGVSHEVVFTGACHFDENKVIGDLKRICDYQIQFFGEPAPVKRYVFLVMVVDSGYGGLEHRASTALMISRECLPKPNDVEVGESYLNFLGLCSHEYFHTWNVKRIKPARFVPYALNAESYTRLLWFFEGMTSYYDDLVLARTNLIDAQSYLNVLAKTLTRVQRGAGRLLQSVTDSSFDAWHKFYKQDENSPNAIVSYYSKGALVALCLDALLRDNSSDEITLDTLMQTLWTRWVDTGEGLAEDEPQLLASQIAGMDLSGFFERALYSTQELPLEQALRTLGVELVWRARTSSSDLGGASVKTEKSQKKLKAASIIPESRMPKPWLGANVEEAPGGVRIVQTMSEGPAQQAGLSAGDLLVAMNRLSINKADVESHLSRHADLTEISVHYFRLGQLHETLLPLEPAPADTAHLTLVDQNRVNRWLGGARVDT